MLKFLNKQAGKKYTSISTYFTVIQMIMGGNTDLIGLKAFSSLKMSNGLVFTPINMKCVVVFG